TREAHVLADRPEQWRIRLDVDVMHFAIDCETHDWFLRWIIGLPNAEFWTRPTTVSNQQTARARERGVQPSRGRAKSRGVHLPPKARIFYGSGRLLPAVVSGLYEKLDELRKLRGSESIEEILDGVINRQRRFNRVIELESKVVLNVHKLKEFQVLRRKFKQYAAHLAKQKAQDRIIRAKIGQP